MNSHKKCNYKESPIKQQIINSQSCSKSLVKKENFIQKNKTQFHLNYNIECKLGEGSFGEVFKIINKRLKQPRALKIISKLKKVSFDPYNQLEILKKLDHPSILKIYQYYETKDQWYIITEFFSGKELFQKIIDDDKLSQNKAAQITFEILKALNYIHSNNIAHRDIKAQNILVKENSEQGYSIKLIDWGLGILVSGEELIRKCGTPQYCAPQVLKGKYNISCDMWSFGVLLYIMLSGYMPFKGENIKQTLALAASGKLHFSNPVWKDISAEAKDLIQCLIQKNPQKRWTANNCLKHPWIINNVIKNQQKIRIKSFQSLKETLERIKQCKIENKFQIVIINFINNYLSQEKELEKLKKEFEILDQNNDGVLTYQELLQGYKKVYQDLEAEKIVEKIFNSIDLDGSGKIQYSQFITFASQKNKRYSEEQLKEAFKLFDRDNDGEISKVQIYNLIKYERGTEDSHLQRFIDCIDINGDGTVNFQQFLKCVNNSLEQSKKLKKTKNNTQKIQKI